MQDDQGGGVFIHREECVLQLAVHLEALCFIPQWFIQ